jgi:hypothetical protein
MLLFSKSSTLRLLALAVVATGWLLMTACGPV